MFLIYINIQRTKRGRIFEGVIDAEWNLLYKGSRINNVINSEKIESGAKDLLMI